MNPNLAADFLYLKQAAPLAVRIFTEHSTSPLAIEPVRSADLADAAGEAWRDGCLRTGHPNLPLSEMAMRLHPVRTTDHAARCAGFRLELGFPGAGSTPPEFTIHSLRHMAERAAAPLVAAGVLQAGQNYTYDVAIDASAAAPSPTSEAGIAMGMSVRSAPLAYLKVPLRGLLRRATPMALLDDEVFPVFYTQEAFAKAEACARHGAQREPPVETGGVLLGSLIACPDCGEFGAVVTDVIEVQDAEEATFSLSYSSRSWMRLQSILKARQAAYPERVERFLGQSHGHSFRPNDGQTCTECEKRATCTLTSAFVSRDDQAWHRAVFARQPWSLCHIFGLSARGEPVHQLFGLKDGRLQARGFYLLPDFPLAHESTNLKPINHHA
jgi:hypothetical protein